MTDNYKLIECPAEGCDNGINTYAVRSYGGRLTGEEETRDCETCAPWGSLGFIEVDEVESAEEQEAA